MFINILVAAVIGACAGLLWYGLTKIPAIQKQFQKIPKWASLIVVLAVVKIFHPMIADEFNLRFKPQNSYDQDLNQQCLVLKESYPDSLTVEQLEKVRSFTNAKDSEMLRAYLLQLAKAKEAELGKEALRLDRFTDKSRIAEWTHWLTLVSFYEEWERPSPEGRLEYARKRGEPTMLPSGERTELEYTMSATGPGATRLVLRSKKANFPNADLRDRALSGLGSGKRWNDNVGAVGFTSYRFENPEGKGFTIKMTPRGGTLPLLEDDFK